MKVSGREERESTRVNVREIIFWKYSKMLLFFVNITHIDIYIYINVVIGFTLHTYITYIIYFVTQV